MWWLSFPGNGVTWRKHFCPSRNGLKEDIHSSQSKEPTYLVEGKQAQWSELKGNLDLINCTSRLWLEQAVVVAQLEEQSLLIPEVRGSSPVIGKIYI